MAETRYKKRKKALLSWDAWRIFRILSEFVDGFEAMISLGPSVAIFGGSTITSDNPYYSQAVLLASKLVAKKLAIITGGGPGIMEAANKGAQIAKGKSCGLSIDLPTEEHPNCFVDTRYLLKFRYFFIRKVMFVRYAQSFIVFPGGFGTMDELFESLTLIKTKKISRFPIFLVGVSYWSGLIDWLKEVPLRHNNIEPQDLNLIKITDDIDEIVEEIQAHLKQNKYLENF